MNQPEIDPSVLNRVFEALHENMEILDAPSLELYIIGGAAMNMGGHVQRATIDVDLLGITYATESGDGQKFHSEFPDKFQQCIVRVADGFNLMDNWLNVGPAGLAGALPEGFIQRSKQRVIGSRLTLHISSRVDLIYLKTHAVANTFGSPHATIHKRDLKALEPSPSELIRAVNWSRELYRSTRDDYNWDNQYLHDAYRELALEITGKPLPENLFNHGNGSDET